MGKFITGAIVVIVLLAGGGYYAWMKMGETGGSVNVPPVEQLSTYATSTYSISYPMDYTVDEAYAYEGVPKKPIPGVKFVIPGTMATGTNLSSDSGVSVEQLPRAKNCTGDIFIYDKVKASELVTASSTYSVATTSGAGAGNFYEEQVYAIANSQPCTAVRYFIHSGNINNYPVGAVTEFNHAALISQFDKIRNSLTLQ